MKIWYICLFAISLGVSSCRNSIDRETKNHNTMDLLIAQPENSVSRNSAFGAFQLPYALRIAPATMETQRMTCHTSIPFFNTKDVWNSPKGHSIEHKNFYGSFHNKYGEGDRNHAFESQTRNVLLNDSVRTQQENARIAEIELDYRRDTAILQREFYIQLQRDQIETLRLTNYIWVLLSLIVVVGALLFYYYTKKTKDLQRIRYQEQLSRLRLQNIRNRVSPHFTFNVLNQELSAEEDRQKHQSLFSLVNLLRRSLAMTEQISVSLADEIDFVKAYIELEKHRLGEGFVVAWYTSDQLDMNQLRIPSMMMQIPVENAIKHALSPKIGERHLSISITRHKEGVLIVVQDNGTGYYPGKQKTNDSTRTGLKVLYQIIELLNEKNKEKIIFSITNVLDDSGTGTKVEIYIPEHYVFD